MAKPPFLERLSAVRVVIVLIVGGSLAYLLSVQVSDSIAYRLLTPRIIAKADSFLIAGDSVRAVELYEKARGYGVGVDDKLACAVSYQQDPLSCTELFEAMGAGDQLALAKKVDESLVQSPKRWLQQSLELVAIGRPEYARVALKRALDLDPEYPEAKRYAEELGLK